MSRREALFIGDLVEIVRDVNTFLSGVTRERWDSDAMLQAAVLHKLMLVGEIARALPEDLQARHPGTPWRHMRGFRSIAVHQYFSVDLAVVWQIATREIPKLEEQALTMLRDEFPEMAAKISGDGGR